METRHNDCVNLPSHMEKSTCDDLRTSSKLKTIFGPLKKIKLSRNLLFKFLIFKCSRGGSSDDDDDMVLFQSEFQELQGSDLQNKQRRLQ
jgi:hypothetical protein